MKQGTLGAIRINMEGFKPGTALQNGLLFITLYHDLTEDEPAQQYKEVMDKLTKLDIQLEPNQKSQVMTTLVNLWHFQREIWGIDPKTNIKFVFTVDMGISPNAAEAEIASLVKENHAIERLNDHRWDDNSLDKNYYGEV